MNNEFTPTFKPDATSSIEISKKTPSGIKIKMKVYCQAGQSLEDMRKACQREFEAAYAKALLNDLSDVVEKLVDKRLKEKSS